MWIVFIASIIICYVWWKSLGKNLKLPPLYKDQWPILGIGHKLLGKDTKELLNVSDEIGYSCIKNGGVLQMKLGFSLIFAITDPDDSITILNKCLEKSWGYDFAKNWVGDGLASVTNNLDLWKRHRKIISKSFNPQVLEGYMGVFNKQARCLVNELSGRVGKGAFDHRSILEDIALGIMYQTTMNLNEEELNSVFMKECKKAIYDMLTVLIGRFKCVWMINNFIYSFTALKKIEDESLDVLHRASKEIIHRKQLDIRSTDKEPGKFKSFLDLLLELPPEDAFTDKELKEEVDTMVVAGSDTTATMLTYALILLGSHQNVQDKIIDELKVVLGDSLRDVEKPDLSRLVYMEAVLMESMRLYPIMPVLIRHIARDVELKNYTLPAGSTGLVMVRVMHRDPRLWGPDAEAFRPERWLPTPPPAARAFAGFSIGPRGCIGKAYAMMSMKTTLAHLLRHYRIVADVTKLEVQLDSFLKPANGCEIYLEHRK